MSVGSKRRRGSVTVLFPTYGHAQYIGQALTSVLKQTRRPDQIIVVNDGSPDDTAAAVKPFLPDITYIEQEHLGIVEAANQALRRGTSEYIMGFSSDDWLEPTAVETLASVLDDDPEVGLVHGGVRYVDSRGEPLEHVKWVSFPVGKHREVRRLILRNYIAGTAMMFRGRALAESMPLLLPYRSHHDWAQCVSIALTGWHMFGVPQVVTNYRRHENNASAAQNRADTYEDLLAIVADLRKRFRDRLSAEDIESLALAEQYVQRKLAWIALAEGRRSEGRARFVRLWHDGATTRAALGLIASYLPAPVWPLLTATDKALMSRFNVLAIRLKQRI